MYSAAKNGFTYVSYKHEAKLIIVLFMCLRKVLFPRVFVERRLLPLNNWHKWSVIFSREGHAQGASAHRAPQAMTTQQRPPLPAQPCHIWPQRPRTFSFPYLKCTSGSHLTPVRPNFHFRGRSGFQIIYHFLKCFHMFAFPSMWGSCLRPTFSKCIKIQFGPKKFRHWCFIVVMSGNY